MELQHDKKVCPKCKSKLKLIDFKKIGWGMIILTIFFFIAGLYFAEIISPFMDILGIGIGAYLIMKKERFSYYCKKCWAFVGHKEPTTI